MTLRRRPLVGGVTFLACVVISACGADIDETCGGLCVEPDGSTTGSLDASLGDGAHRADGTTGADAPAGDARASEEGAAADASFDDVEAIDADPPDAMDDAPDDGDFVDVEVVDGGLDGDDDSGPACAPHCGQGESCGDDQECLSNACDNGQCAAPGCSPHCVKGAACGDDGDCVSHHCHEGTCR